MKIKELRSKKREELEEQLAQANKELIKLNTQVATGTTLKSPGLVKKTKKTIARILTLLNQKEGSKKDEWYLSSMWLTTRIMCVWEHSKRKPRD